MSGEITGRSRHQFEDASAAREWRQRIFASFTEFKVDLRRIEEKQSLLIDDQHRLSLSLGDTASSEELILSERVLSQRIASLGADIGAVTTKVEKTLHAVETRMNGDVSDLGAQVQILTNTVEGLISSQQKLHEDLKSIDAKSGFRYPLERPLIHGSQILQWVLLVILLAFLRTQGLIGDDVQAPAPPGVEMLLEE